MQTQILETPKIVNWLDECRTYNTRNIYSYRIKDFFQWYEKPIQTFLDLSHAEKRHVCIKFQNEKLGIISPNTINLTFGALNSFLDTLDMKINFGRKIVRSTIDLSSHIFSFEDLSKMFVLGNTKEKALISLFSSLGWECGGVLELKRKKIKELIARAKSENKKFVYFMNQRRKTGVLRLGVLNPLCLKWVGKWIDQTDAKPSKKRNMQNKHRLISDIFDIGLSGVNAMFRKLAQEAQIKKTGRIHSHGFRKFVMGSLVRAGLNEYEVRFFVGKTIPASDFTYLQNLQIGIEEKYPSAFEEFINLEKSSKGILKLSKSLEAKEIEIAEQKIQLEKLQENYLSMQKRINGLSQIRDTSDLLMRDILNDPRFQKLIFDKVAEYGGRLEVREDVTVNGKADVKIHSLGEEDVKKALRP